jgi:hypothetical protein
MRFKSLVILALLSAWLASPALVWAADGDQCKATYHDSAGINGSGATCQETPGVRTWFLCDQQKATGTDTDCGPIVVNVGSAKTCTIDIVTQQPACTITTMTVEESDGTVGLTDAVWTTLGTLTGTPSPLLSQIDPLRPVGPVLRATFTDITDTDCTNVSVVVKCFYY